MTGHDEREVFVEISDTTSGCALETLPFPFSDDGRSAIERRLADNQPPAVIVVDGCSTHFSPV